MTHPKAQKQLLGHLTCIEQFLKSHKINRLHHAILLNGARGIGKATFAYHIARFLVSKSPDKISRIGVDQGSYEDGLIKSSMHPNLLAIEGAQDVNSIRKITKFLHLKSYSGYKIIIVDSVEQLNKNASNALLKMIEEPPKNTIFLLVSHNKNNVLPTIISRCYVMRFPRLGFEDFSNIVRLNNPRVSETHDLKHLYELSGHSPGKALSMINDGFFDFFDSIHTMVSDRKYTNIMAAIAKLKEGDDRWGVMKGVVQGIFLTKLKKEISSSQYSIKALENAQEILKILNDGEQHHINKDHTLITALG